MKHYENYNGYGGRILMMHIENCKKCKNETQKKVIQKEIIQQRQKKKPKT